MQRSERRSDVFMCQSVYTKSVAYTPLSDFQWALSLSHCATVLKTCESRGKQSRNRTYVMDLKVLSWLVLADGNTTIASMVCTKGGWNGLKRMRGGKKRIWFQWSLSFFWGFPSLFRAVDCSIWVWTGTVNMFAFLPQRRMLGEQERKINLIISLHRGQCKEWKSG